MRCLLGLAVLHDGAATATVLEVVNSHFSDWHESGPQFLLGIPVDNTHEGMG